MVYKFFNKNLAGKGVNTHANKSVCNNERVLDFATRKLVKELHKPITRKFEKKKSLFRIQRQYLACWFSW